MMTGEPLSAPFSLAAAAFSLPAIPDRKMNAAVEKRNRIAWYLMGAPGVALGLPLTCAPDWREWSRLWRDELNRTGLPLPRKRAGRCVPSEIRQVVPRNA